MLHRRVFAVGLDGRELVFELRQATRINRDVLFELTSFVAIGLELLFRGVDRALGFVESRIERGEFLRMEGDARPRLGDDRFQVLELDEAF